MRLVSYIPIFLVFLVSFNGFSQDSIPYFGYSDFLEIVRNHHPISYQANLQIDRGEAELLKGKGGFDPKLFGAFDQKNYDGKQYYSHFNSGLKIPTWFGLSFQGGYQNNSGEYLNPEEFVPQEGLWYAGVELNLGNGLIIDQRRAELQTARVFQEISRVEQRLVINNLIFDASIAYWDWFKAYHKMKVYEDATDKAKFRLDAVIQSADIGDQPFIDTLQAMVLYQDRQIKLEQAHLELMNKKAKMEIFLWENGFFPLELDSTVQPYPFENVPEFQSTNLNSLNMDTLVENHPLILKSKYNIDLTDIEFRLKRESLKPNIQLKYNALMENNFDNGFNDYSTDNYTWGAKVSYPIFIRKERGAVQLSRIKLQEMDLKLKDTQVKVAYQIQAAYNTYLSMKRQVNIYSSTVKNYSSLLTAEEQLFYMGESSLFMVNTRDQYLLDVQIKYVDILYKQYEALVDYNYQIFAY